MPGSYMQTRQLSQIMGGCGNVYEWYPACVWEQSVHCVKVVLYRSPSTTAAKPVEMFAAKPRCWLLHQQHMAPLSSAQQTFVRPSRMPTDCR